LKLSINTDFTKLPRAGRIIRAGETAAMANLPLPFDVALLAHDERRLRRKVIKLAHGDLLFVDLPVATGLGHGDLLALDDGRLVKIIAAEEDLLEVIAGKDNALAELAWHIGNRHLAAQIEPERIVILADPVIEAMLRDLGAHTRAIREPFTPMGGAYGDAVFRHGHGHGHGHEH
jgi:urease accessory protein